MFGRWHLIILDSNKEVDRLMLLAANHHLIAMYKIGVYGKELQNELYVKGSIWNYFIFRQAMKPKKGS